MDRSVKNEGRRCGFGVIMRYGRRGDRIGSYYHRLSPCTSLEAELHAILVGLEILKGMRCHNVAFETDSLAVINLMQNPTDENSPHVTLMEDIQALLGAAKCIIEHALREGNFYVDYLANLGADDLSFVSMEAPNEELKKLMVTDYVRVTTTART